MEEEKVMTKEAEQALQAIKHDVVQALEYNARKGGMNVNHPPKMSNAQPSILLQLLITCNHGLGLDPHDKKV